MKKYFLATPLLLAVTALAGCGGGGKDDGKIIVDFWHTFGDKPETALQAKADAFKAIIKEHDGVDVEIRLSYQGAYKDMPTKVSNGMQDGEMPTMVVAYADHVANYMDKEGNTPGKYVVNLDDFINGADTKFGSEAYIKDTEDVNDIIKSYLDEGRQMPRSGTYLLPYMKSTEIMTYNLTAARVIVPTVFPEVLADKVENFMKTISWSQLMQIAEAVKGPLANKFPTVEYPVYYDSDSNLFITELFQRGIPYSSCKDGSGVIDFEEPTALAKAKTMVNELREAHNNHLLTTKGTEGTYASNNFKEIKTLFSIGSSGGTGYTIPAGGEFDVGFAKVPTMGDEDSKIKYISQGPSICFLKNPAISAESNNTKLKYAWKFAKYILSKDINTQLCVNGSEGYSPVRESCYTTETYSDFIETGDNYAKAALVTQNDIAGRYFNSAVFIGSATLREQVGAIISTGMSKPEMSTDKIFEDAISNAKKDIK